MIFVWDALKADSNWRKHGVTFDEAASIWNDKHGVEVFDDTHSTPEDRFWRIGFSDEKRLLMVVFCERAEETIRIISARPASRADRQLYREG